MTNRIRPFQGHPYTHREKALLVGKYKVIMLREKGFECTVIRLISGKKKNLFLNTKFSVPKYPSQE